MARSNVSGVEFESGIKINPQFSFINNLTWLYGENLDNGKPMRRIPPLNGKLALQYSKSKIFAETEFLFAAKQDRLSGGDIDDHRIPDGGTPGWNILNLKAGYTWRSISVNAGLQNVFNQAGFTVREWTVLADRFGQPCCLNFKKIAFPFSSDCQRNCRRYWEGIVASLKATPTVSLKRHRR